MQPKFSIYLRNVLKNFARNMIMRQLEKTMPHRTFLLLHSYFYLTAMEKKLQENQLLYSTRLFSRGRIQFISTVVMLSWELFSLMDWKIMKVCVTMSKPLCHCLCRTKRLALLCHWKILLSLDNCLLIQLLCFSFEHPRFEPNSHLSRRLPAQDLFAPDNKN